MAALFLLAALLQEPVSSTLYGSRFLTGEVGRSVTHQCFYSITPANKHDRKYWCKLAGNGVCNTIISTTGYTSKDHMGRVSLEDIPQDGTFRVTMTDLKENDTGTYRCGIGTTNRDLYVTLNLRVSADAGALGPIELIQGEFRGSVSILCPPGDTQGGKKRFWCKLGRTSCVLIADTNGYVGKSYQGRIFITPQESSGAFRILINDLKKEDSGLYRCGTGRLSTLDSPQVVALQVTAVSALPKTPKFLSGTVGSSLSLKCHYDPKGNYDKKYLCRWKDAHCSVLVDADGFVHKSYEGRIQIASSDQEKGTYTVVMSHLQEEDAGWYWCGAKNRHTEHTSSVKLLIQKENRSSQEPETSTLVKPTLSSSLTTCSTPTHRSITGLTYTVGTVTESTSTLPPATPPSTLPSATPPSTLPPATPSSTLPPATPSSTLPPATPSSTLPPATPSSTLPPATPPSTLPPATLPSTFVTSPSQIYDESSSREPRLLPVVLPALILLIFIIITLLTLAQLKLQKEIGGERSTIPSLEAAPSPPGPNPLKEQMMEEKVPKCRIIYAILGRFRMTN